MAQFFLNFQVISEKKGLRGEMAQFFPDFLVISKKEIIFGLSFRSMCPIKPSGPSHGPPKPHGSPDEPP